MTNYEKLITVLEEIFQLNQADLDFGIYRILNQKQEEIKHFLYKKLVPQVKTIIQQSNLGDTAKLKKELEETIAQARALGADPETLPKVQDLRARYQVAPSPESLENEIFSHLTAFFKRYYKDGDFISMRRYKKDVYAIPYEGEEVKLYWANHDQYYIKTSEHLKNYAFKLSDGRLVRFELLEASTEKDNRKEESGKERRFKIYAEKPLEAGERTLTLFFTYEPTDKNEKQDKLNDAASALIKKHLPADWIPEVLEKAPTEKDKNRTLLDKHLKDFTARNTFDYFIHKDLGGFLTRELDFYIKNEVLHLEDINTSSLADFQKQLVKVQALRDIGGKIIAFLAQIENFQKKLWLKKKFVVETQYCITLDRIPEAFYPEIAANEAQRAEWVRLFAIDEIKKDLMQPGYSVPLKLDFLKGHPHLVLDTAFFSEDFKLRLLAAFDDLDEQLDGVLINSENFQALNLLRDRFRQQVKCIYIDPPYNTGNDDFLYKDNFQQSSWMSMLSDRVQLSSYLLEDQGTFSMSIDIKELDKSIYLLDVLFGEENRKSNITIKRGSVTGAKVINPGVVNVSENVIMYSKNANNWTPERAYRQREYDSRYNTMIINLEESFEKWEFQTVLDKFSEETGIEKSKLRKHFGEDYDRELTRFVIDNSEKIIRFASLDESSISQEAVEVKKISQKNPEKLFHVAREGKNDYFIKGGNLILFYRDRLINIGKTIVPGAPVSDIWDDVLPNDLHNEGGVSLRKGKKPEKLIHRIFDTASKEKETILDYFVGSGTASAVAQKSNRSWIAIEGGEYFRSITIKRMKNTLFGERSGVSKLMEWQGGGFFKYMSLESYEDTLNNLVLRRRDGQQQLLGLNERFEEEYMLSYLLDVESEGSLLNVDHFENPFDYQLNIIRDNEAIPTRLDLVETFNYLIGLKVKTTERIRGFHVVTGESLAGEQILVIWRNLREKSNADLNEFFQKQQYNTRDREFDRIYVNGDNNLENLKIGDEKWKVVLIEEAFLRGMFEVRDV